MPSYGRNAFEYIQKAYGVTLSETSLINICQKHAQVHRFDKGIGLENQILQQI